MRSRRVSVPAADHGLQRRARHRNHARMTHAHGIRRPADARAQGQRYRPLQGFETAGLHHLARTLGHKLGIPYLRSNGGHAPVPGTAVRTGLNTSEKCNGCRAFHKPEGAAALASGRALSRRAHATRAPAGALCRTWRPTCAAPARGARTRIRLRPARCAACGAAARQRPQQLVAHGEGAQVLRAHRQLAQAAHRDVQRAGHGHRGQRSDGVFAVLGTTGPLRALGDQRFDLVDRQVALELDGQRLAVAAHGADTRTGRRSGWRACRRRRRGQDLVGLDLALPLFRTCRCPDRLSIQGIRLPPSGTPKCSWGSAGSCCLASTPRSISGMADAGSSSSGLTAWLISPNWVSSSRMCYAPPPEAAW